MFTASTIWIYIDKLRFLFWIISKSLEYYGVLTNTSRSDFVNLCILDLKAGYCICRCYVQII